MRAHRRDFVIWLGGLTFIALLYRVPLDPFGRHTREPPKVYRPEGFSIEGVSLYRHKTRDDVIAVMGPKFAKDIRGNLVWPRDSRSDDPSLVAYFREDGRLYHLWGNSLEYEGETILPHYSKVETAVGLSFLPTGPPITSWQERPIDEHRAQTVPMVVQNIDLPELGIELNFQDDALLNVDLRFPGPRPQVTPIPKGVRQ